MQREYLFRGKRKDNNKWTYGSLIRDVDVCRIHVYGTGESHEVFPDTVGQCIGLKDNSGFDIYEGDIVLTKKFWKYPHSVKKRWKRFHGLVKFEISQTCGQAEWDVFVQDVEDYDYEAYGPFDDCKVISNIHDAPHLLNQPTGGALNMNIDPNLKAEEATGEVAAPAEQATEQESAEEGSTEG